jgi:hypothetical protein
MIPKPKKDDCFKDIITKEKVEVYRLPIYSK